MFGLHSSLTDQIPALRADFPSYDFSIASTWYGVAIVATRTEPGSGPLVMITADVGELRRCLQPESASHETGE